MAKSKTEKFYDDIWEKADFPLRDHYVHQRIAKGNMPGARVTSSGKSRSNSPKQPSRKR